MPTHCFHNTRATGELWLLQHNTLFGILLLAIYRPMLRSFSRITMVILLSLYTLYNKHHHHFVHYFDDWQYFKYSLHHSTDLNRVILDHLIGRPWWDSAYQENRNTCRAFFLKNARNKFCSNSWFITLQSSSKKYIFELQTKMPYFGIILISLDNIIMESHSWTRRNMIRQVYRVFQNITRYFNFAHSRKLL